MVLDPKHFDDIDDFCDFEEKLDTSSDGDVEGGPNQALSWRRVIIERAANNVKKAHEHKADVKASYKKGSLVFDEQANRFGRVLESRPGFLNMSLIAGGNLMRHDVNPMDFVRANRHKLTLPEIAKAVFLTEVEVMILLNQIELENERPVAAMPTATLKAKQKPMTVVKTAMKAKPASAKKRPEVKLVSNAKPAKPSVKIAAKQKSVAIKKPLVKKDVSFTKLLPKGATTDPVVDPNGYIQQNFLLMSNRELATATGLSEHTIRRKLGEWNLKRKDYVNKA